MAVPCMDSTRETGPDETGAWPPIRADGRDKAPAVSLLTIASSSITLALRSSYSARVTYFSLRKYRQSKSRKGQERHTWAL